MSKFHCLSSARFFSSLAFLVTALLASGCRQQITSSYEFRNAATQRLGLPVNLWAYPDDYCVNSQLRILYEQYDHLDHAAVVRRFRVYSSVVVNSSQGLGVMQGSLAVIRLVGQGDVRTRVISDSRQTAAGHLPGTMVERDADLSLTPTYAYDRSTIFIYETTNQNVFRLVGTNNFINLETARQRGLVRLVSSQAGTGTLTCGNFAHLDDLFVAASPTAVPSSGGQR